MKFCPSCGSPVKHGEQYCGHCGNPLQLEVSSPSAQHGYEYPGQRPLNTQQSEWNQSTQYNQPPARGNRNPAQKQTRTEDQRVKPQKKRSSRGFLLLVILIVLILIVSGVALVVGGTFSSTNKSPSITPSPTAPTQPAATPPSSTPESPQPPTSQTQVLPTSQATPITAAELIKAYTDDSIGSGDKYNGNVYVISGTVSSVLGIYPAMLFLADKAAGPFEIQCTFLQGQESDVALINPGQSVKVEGKVLRFNRIIVVDKCRLVQ